MKVFFSALIFLLLFLFKNRCPIRDHDGTVELWNSRGASIDQCVQILQFPLLSICSSDSVAVLVVAAAIVNVAIEILSVWDAWIPKACKAYSFYLATWRNNGFVGVCWLNTGNFEWGPNAVFYKLTLEWSSCCLPKKFIKNQF